MNLKKMALIVLLPLMLANCGVLGDISPYQNPGNVVGAGIAGAAATKVVDKVKDIAEFIPDLKLEQLELCVKSAKRIGQFRCVLLSCEVEDKKHCSRYVDTPEAYADIESREAVIINTRAWAKFISAVEVFCGHEKIDCNKVKDDYPEIKTMYLVGDSEG